MAGYICPTCGKSSKLPGFCCGKSMAQKGMYFCDSCKNQSNSASQCCGSAMREL